MVKLNSDPISIYFVGSFSNATHFVAVTLCACHWCSVGHAVEKLLILNLIQC